MLADYTVMELIVAAGILAAGAAVQAGIGFGIALVSVPFLALLNPALVPGPLIVAALALSCMTSWRDRRWIHRPEWATITAGVLAGTAAGVGVLLSVPAQYLPVLFGVMILLAVLITALNPSFAIDVRSLLITGSLAGLIGTCVGIHGPPVALLYQGQPPDRVRAMLSAFFLVAYPIALAGLALSGFFGWSQLLAGLATLPGIALGYALGPYLARHVDARRLRALILSISAVSGLLLIVRSL
ncbi:MAG: sulfite exporter TauE/SafE family protein [Hyphomicrobiales bacterium]